MGSHPYEKYIVLITYFYFSHDDIPEELNGDIPKKLAGVDQIKDILIKDKLLIEKDKKIISDLKKEIEIEKQVKLHNQPVSEIEFWELITHLWLVKRENKLKWDF